MMKDEEETDHTASATTPKDVEFACKDAEIGKKVIEIEKGKAAPIVVLIKEMVDEVMGSLTARIGGESVERIEGLRVWILDRGRGRRRSLLVPSEGEDVLAKVEHLLFDRPEDRLLCDLEDGLV